jgi:hypothetical protein
LVKPETLFGLLRHDITKFRHELHNKGFVSILKPLTGHIDEMIMDVRDKMEYYSFIIETHHLEKLFNDNVDDFEVDEENEFDVSWYSGQNLLLSLVWTGHTITVAGSEHLMMQS